MPFFITSVLKYQWVVEQASCLKWRSIKVERLLFSTLCGPENIGYCCGEGLIGSG
jgi:hypothetical protein